MAEMVVRRRASTLESPGPEKAHMTLTPLPREGPPPYTYDNLGYTAHPYDVPLDLDANGQQTTSFNQPPVETNGYARAKGQAEEYEDMNCFMRGVTKIQDGFTLAYAKYEVRLKQAFLILLLMLYFAYFGYAMYYERLDCEDSIRLCWVTCLVVFVWVVSQLWRPLAKPLKPCTSAIAAHWETISWVLVAFLYVGWIVFIIVDATTLTKHPTNLISGAGIVTYVLLLFIFSHSPSQVKWRPVVWGLALQFILALIILRWKAGFEAFDWLGKRVSEFLAHTDAGSAFVFGDPQYQDHFFAFKVLPVIVYFSAIVSVLYYLGAMQKIIHVLAVPMQALMGTTAAESLNAAGNIFVSQNEAPLLIKPMLGDMTRSEMHAVMTGGYATIAGSVMAGYILMGVKANHLISASVMSAPAALAMAKLFYPETEKVTKKDVVSEMADSPERNIIEAASSGASTACGLVANIAANLIAFIALLHFVNATLAWFGARVGVDGFTLEFILSYVLWPFAFLMGVDEQNCRQVAELVGIKTILNEFVAYGRLGDLITNKEVTNFWVQGNGTSYTYSNSTILLNGTSTWSNINLMTDPVQSWYKQTFSAAKVPTGSVGLTGPVWLLKGILTERSEVITTYALCGFANIGSLGIQLGGLGALAPHRKADLAATVVRAMIAGNVACFMTACIAGLLYQGELA